MHLKELKDVENDTYYRIMVSFHGIESTASTYIVLFFQKWVVKKEHGQAEISSLLRRSVTRTGAKSMTNFVNLRPESLLRTLREY